MNTFTYKPTLSAAVVAEIQAGSIHDWLEQEGINLESVSIRSDGTVLIESDDNLDVANTLRAYFNQQSAHAVDRRHNKLEALEAIDLSKPTLTEMRDAFMLMRELLLDRER